MKTQSEKQSSQRSIQDYLSLGYLYLLTLGIIREVIYFGFLDVNILSYSNVLDVILSPLVLMSKKPKVLVILIIFAIVVYFLNGYILKKQKKSSLKSASSNEKVFTKSEVLQGAIFLYALFVFSFYIGTGLGSGQKHSSILEKGEFDMSHEITFVDNEKIQAKVLGSNSQYIFYVLENGKNVSISPIQSNVKKIEKLSDSE